MKTRRFRFANRLGLLLLLTLGLVPASAVQQEDALPDPGTPGFPIQLYVVPTASTQANADTLDQLKDDLARETGLAFAVEYGSLQELNTELSYDRPDAIVLLSGSDYADLHSATQGTLVMSMATVDAFGLNYTYAAIYALRDSGIETPADLQNRTGAYRSGDWPWPTVESTLLTEQFGYGDIEVGKLVEVGDWNYYVLLEMLYEGRIDFFVDWGSPPDPTGVSDDTWSWGDDPERGIWDKECECLIDQELRWRGTDIRASAETAFPDVWERVGIVDVAGPLGYSGLAFSSLFPADLKVHVMEAISYYAASEDGSKLLDTLGYGTVEEFSYIPDSYYDAIRIVFGHAPIVFPYRDEPEDSVICKVGQARFRGSIGDCENRSGVIIGFMPPWTPPSITYPPVFFSMTNSSGGTPGYGRAGQLAGSNPKRGVNWGGTERYVPKTHDCDDFAHDLERYFEANGIKASFTVIAEKNPNYRKGNGQPYWTSGHAVVDVRFADGTIALFDGQSGCDVTRDYDCNKDGKITYYDGVYSTETTDCNFCICVYEDRAAAEAAGETLD